MIIGSQAARLVVSTRLQTGTEALEDVYKGRAQVAAAAAGLLKLYKDTVIDLEIVMSPPRAFNVITYAEKRGLDLFEDSVVLHPKGSDLERLLVVLGIYSSQNRKQFSPCRRDEAVELLSPLPKSKSANEYCDVAWNRCPHEFIWNWKTGRVQTSYLGTMS